MMNKWHPMGLPKPETDPQDAAAMRRAIEGAQRDSSLIRNCLMHARYSGMSAEDTYTLLAYHALRSLEDIYQTQLQMLSTSTAETVSARSTSGDVHGS
jgi:hypothetical protein